MQDKFVTINYLIVRPKEVALARKKSPNLTEGELRLMNVVWKEGREIGRLSTSRPSANPRAARRGRKATDSVAWRACGLALHYGDAEWSIRKR
jgi:hypothetical protein